MRILIIGASGFLGSTIYKDISHDKNHFVIGTYYKNKVDADHIELNVCDKSNVSQLVDKINPDAIIWSICDPEMERVLTNSGLVNILQVISDKLKLIYISSTVSTGAFQHESKEPVYRTEDMYLYQYMNGKIDGEKLVRSHPNHIIVRPGSIYGVDGYGRLDNRTEKIKQAIANKMDYVRASNLVTSFVDVGDLSKAIIELINIDFTGTINIASNIPISHYSFSVKRAQQLGLNNKYILAETKKNGYEYSLDTNKLHSISKTTIKNL